VRPGDPVVLRHRPFFGPMVGNRVVSGALWTRALPSLRRAEEGLPGIVLAVVRVETFEDGSWDNPGAVVMAAVGRIGWFTRSELDVLGGGS
jgi:hypothetical protein